MRRLLLPLLWLLLTGPLDAQEKRPLAVRFDPAGGGAVLTIGEVLADREMVEAAGAGLTIRLRLRTELWRDGFVDKLVESITLNHVIAFEPLTRRYFLRSSAGDLRSRVFPSFEAARQALETDYPVRTITRREGRYYYTATLDIETFSPSDLDELERWLQGNLQPAVSGDQSLAGAVGHGAKQLLIRVLGVPNRHYEARSARFRID